MLKRLKLIEAREHANLTQEELAEKFGTTRVSISYWENAVTVPSSYYRRKIKAFFAVDDLDAFLAVIDEPDEIDKSPPLESTHISMIPSSLWHPEATVQHFIASQPARQFWHIAHTDYDTTTELNAAIGAAIKDMTMTTGNELTRREALCELASIPLIAMGRNATLKASRYEEMLRFCTAALEGCWELSQGSDMQGIRHAFECVSTYIPLLETIAHESPRHCKQALDLATRYQILKTRLAWTCATPDAAAGCAEHAFFLSKETGNTSLLMGACTKLTWSYFRNKNYAMGLKTIQEGEQVIKSYQRRNKGPALPSGMIGNFNSSKALAEVYNGLDPDRAIKAATDSEPLTEYIAFVEFTEDDQHYEAAKIYCLKGDPEAAMRELSKLINIETLALLPGVNQIEGVRLHIANHLTSALLQMPEKDMGQIMGTWTTAIEGARTRHNEVIYDEAMQNFAVMRALWGHEDAIRRLMPLTSHW